MSDTRHVCALMQVTTRHDRYPLHCYIRAFPSLPKMKPRLHLKCKPSSLSLVLFSRQLHEFCIELLSCHTEGLRRSDDTISHHPPALHCILCCRHFLLGRPVRIRDLNTLLSTALWGEEHRCSESYSCHKPSPLPLCQCHSILIISLLPWRIAHHHSR